MRIVKLCLITLLVLEVLAIVTHFSELLSYTGSIVSGSVLHRRFFKR